MLRRFISPGIGVLALLWLAGNPALLHAQRGGGFRGGFTRNVMPGFHGGFTSNFNGSITRSATPGSNATSFTRSFHQSIPGFNTTLTSPFNRPFPAGTMGGFPTNRRLMSGLTPGFGGISPGFNGM